MYSGSFLYSLPSNKVYLTNHIMINFDWRYLIWLSYNYALKLFSVSATVPNSCVTLHTTRHWFKGWLQLSTHWLKWLWNYGMKFVAIRFNLQKEQYRILVVMKYFFQASWTNGSRFTWEHRNRWGHSDLDFIQVEDSQLDFDILDKFNLWH